MVGKVIDLRGVYDGFFPVRLCNFYEFYNCLIISAIGFDMRKVTFCGPIADLL